MSSPPVTLLTCPYCGAEMTNRKRVQCGAPDCQRQYHRDRNREIQQRLRSEYEGRGENYRDRWDRKKYPGGRQRWPEAHQANDSIRRARKKSAETESFTHEEIYNRDGWVCQLCKKKVDKKLKYPHDMSASLDHERPLSRGGDHTRANVQLAHLTCNLAKGARYG